MIETFINEHLAALQNIPRTSSGKFSVSDAGGCHLARYWKRQGTKQRAEFDARTLRVFEVGKILHDWVQTILDKRGVLVVAEYRMEDKHRAGLLDAIVQENGKFILYDLKTVHSRKFMWIKKEADIHYHYQAATYTSMVKSQPEDVLLYEKGIFTIDETRLCYISKDDLLIKEVPVFVTQEELDADWGPLIEAWEQQKEPAPNPREEWLCSWCSYVEHCEYGKKVVAKKEAKKKEPKKAKVFDNNVEEKKVFLNEIDGIKRNRLTSESI